MRPRLISILQDLGLSWVTTVLPTPGVMSLSLDEASTAALWAFVIGLVGSRLYYLVVNNKLGDGIHTWWSFSTGTASWGAYLGATLGLTGYLRWSRAPVLPYLDVGASCAGVGIFLGRWSCLLAGDDFGRVTAVPWAIRYPAGSYPYNSQIAAGFLHPPAMLSLPTHPLQLYLGFTALVVFGVVTMIWRRRRAIPGFTLSAYLILDASTRFIWEFFRDPAAGGARSFPVAL